MARRLSFPLLLLAGAHCLGPNLLARPSEEFVLNTHLPDPQVEPRVALSPDGTALFAWDSWLQDGDNWGVFARGFSSDGQPLNDDFAIPQFTEGFQGLQDVVYARDDLFLVVWLQNDLSQGLGPLKARLVSATGEFATEDSSVTTGIFPRELYRNARAASDGSGSFIVTWDEYSDVGRNYVKFRLLNRDARPAGPTVAVNEVNEAFEGFPSVASAPDGSFAIFWTADRLYVRLYRPDGTPLTDEMAIYSPGDNFIMQAFAAAIGDSGDYFVAWEEQGFSSNFIFGARVSGSGEIVSDVLQISDATSGTQPFHPDVASNAAGDLVVAWTDAFPSGDAHWDTYARRLDASGKPEGEVFRLHRVRDDVQIRAEIALAQDGDLAAAWSRFPVSNNPDDYDVFATFARKDVASIALTILPNPVPVLHPHGYLYFFILSDEDVTAAQIDLASVRFGPLEGTPLWEIPYDVNLDGVDDLFLLFDIAGTGLRCGDLEAKLSLSFVTGWNVEQLVPLRHFRCGGSRARRLDRSSSSR